ncbi:kinesin family member 3B [Monoraphidium neglectum]|uniref:Kinesin-like protein n=1 Tax=Monoraphidium neglectum TaxID=145388 RepID=A0A0D2N151_9CHLO|nr:kinesin family member 3B [Monoraphidium neglectum]KIZ06247.1 kinesin family member 3B [Monoraphidium neglectum]|eukprot:XP_013905266.1 kinesin family member 3B [Monoraphidium neglectum]
MAKAAEAVKVVVRCRPLNSQEKQDGRERVVDMDVRAGQVTLRNSKADGGEAPKMFTFDQVYDWDSNQKEIFEITARPIIDAVMDGYNGTIFAYGQTGTGKSFTMEGKDEPPELRGIIPGAFNYIFETIARQSGSKEFLVRASYLEIYNEDIRDLLSKSPEAKLELKESPDRGVYVKDLMQFVVKGVPEISSVLQVGKKNRVVGATMMNQDSSRSHSIFSITIETTERIAPGAQAAAAADGHIRVGKLNLVDLAGSERQSKTGATGDRLKEGIKINLSLTALGNVISALVDGKSSHIPYRDSKLTRLLQDSLGGNTKTVMVANVGPADWNYDETLSTLRYANRAKNITNKPRINEDPKDAMLRQFQDEITRLKEQLAARQAAGGGAGGGGGGGGQPRVVERVVEVVADEALMEKIRGEMKAEIEAKVRSDISAEAAAAVRAEAEANAHKQLEAAMAESGRSEEQRRALREALKRRLADMAALQAAAEGERREQAELLAKIKAMEGKVLHGGVNLLDKVDELKARSVATKQEMEVRRRQQEEQQRRLQQLQLHQLDLNQAYTSLEDEVAQKSRQLRALYAEYQEKKGEAAGLSSQFQSEREALLDDYRSLTRQVKLKNLVIACFIPPAYQEVIMDHCHWDEYDEAWRIDHAEYAGNVQRAQQEQQLQKQRAQQAAEADLYTLDCRRMEGLYYSYASMGDDLAGSPSTGGGGGSPRRTTAQRPGTAGRRGAGALNAALAAAAAVMGDAVAAGGQGGLPNGGKRPGSARGGGGDRGVAAKAAPSASAAAASGGAGGRPGTVLAGLAGPTGAQLQQQGQQQLLQQKQQQQQQQQQLFPSARGLVKASVDGMTRPASARARRD